VATEQRIAAEIYIPLTFAAAVTNKRPKITKKTTIVCRKAFKS
jgi:hypothetical protein